jgi:flagellar brake protein
MNSETSLTSPRLTDSQQLVIHELSSPDHQQWVLRERAEILSVLSALQTVHARADVFFSQSPGSIVTSIVAIDAGRGALIFDPDVDPARNQGIASSDVLAWKSSIRGIKVEFITGPVQWTKFQNTAAFLVEIPDQVLRLQRRNAFRTPTTTGRPIFVTFDMAGVHSSERRARIVNISALGLCLLIDSTRLPVATGVRLEAARFELPGYGEVRCDLEIRYIAADGTAAPRSLWRCGAQFARLAHTDEILIARYVNDAQREQVRLRA